MKNRIENKMNEPKTNSIVLSDEELDKLVYERRLKRIRRGQERMKQRAIDNTERQVLTKEQEDAAVAFYAPYTQIDPVYHNYYTEKTGVFDVRYLPDDVYYYFIDYYFNDHTAAYYLDNKCNYEKMYPGIKAPDTILRRINGFWFADGKMIPQTEAEELLSAENAIFVKQATGSYGGHDVHFLSANAKTEEGCEKGDEPKENAILAGFRKIAESSKVDLVIQRPIRQHPDLAKINDSSVNTIRMLSVLSDNGVKIYSTILRMGISGAKVDNASSGGITCGVLPDGHCRDFGFYSYVGGGKNKKRYEHPTSGLPFGEIVIPCFDKLKELVKKAHPMMPWFRMISWDLAVDEHGDAVLIESNLCDGELDFHQLNNGPLFGEDTEAILKEVYENYTI